MKISFSRKDLKKKYSKYTKTYKKRKNIKDDGIKKNTFKDVKLEIQ